MNMFRSAGEAVRTRPLTPASRRPEVLWLSLLLFCLILLPAIACADNREFYDKLQSAIQSKDENAYLALFAGDQNTRQTEKASIEDLLSFQYEKAILRLADDQKDKLIVHVLLQGKEEARLESWSFSTVLEAGHTLAQSRRVVSSVGGLYRLRISEAGIPVQNASLKHFDTTLRMSQGKIFLITAAGEVAGFVFVGDATLEFTPGDPKEQQQLTLFCKQKRLVTPVTSFYIRTSASNIKKLLGDLVLKSAVSDPVLYPQAKLLAQDGNLAAFNVNIPMTNEVWFPRIEEDNLFCQMKTQYGTLLYQYSASERDNVLLVQKEKEQIISLYRVNNDDLPPAEEDFQILDYRMKLHYAPENYSFAAVTDIRVKSMRDVSTVLFKLNPALRVTRINSSQGPLIHFQENQTKSLHLVLNERVAAGQEISFTFYYTGSLEPELSRTEAQSGPSRVPPVSPRMPELQQMYVPPSYLYSNQTLWYPQLNAKTFCPVTMEITVPAGYAAIANGNLIRTEVGQNEKTFSFQTIEPVRYFSLVIARLAGYFKIDSVVPISVYYDSLDKKMALEYARSTDKILRYYSEYFGPYPYPNFTLVLRPLKEPGGHAPAAMAIVNRVYTFWQLKFRKDPLYQPEFPMLLLAHEIAHQWWGQSVGWRDYEDQWLSEGFAQFAAWEYIRFSSGDRDWTRLARIFSDWIEDKTYAGPLILGARLGHLTEDPKAFSAVVYHKGAYVLNMLKNWMGKDAFHAAMQDYYRTYQFKFAGVDDFEKIAQKHCSEPLDRFFRQWLYQWEVPAVRYDQEIEKNGQESVLKLHFVQTHSDFYLLRIPVEARKKDGSSFKAVVNLDSPTDEFTLKIPFAPDSVLVDPMRENLMKATKKN